MDCSEKKVKDSYQIICVDCVEKRSLKNNGKAVCAKCLSYFEAKSKISDENANNTNVDDIKENLEVLEPDSNTETDDNET